MTKKMLNLIHANSLQVCTINYSINATCVGTTRLRVIYTYYTDSVYKCDSSVYLYGHLLFSYHGTILPINAGLAQITTITQEDKRN